MPSFTSVIFFIQFLLDRCWISSIYLSVFLSLISYCPCFGIFVWFLQEFFCFNFQCFYQSENILFVLSDTNCPFLFSYASFYKAFLSYFIRAISSIISLKPKFLQVFCPTFSVWYLISKLSCDCCFAFILNICVKIYGFTN